MRLIDILQIFLIIMMRCIGEPGIMNWSIFSEMAKVYLLSSAVKIYYENYIDRIKNTLHSVRL
jgi:hypothetical protein